jgi:hypothetical protein
LPKTHAVQFGPGVALRRQIDVPLQQWEMTASPASARIPGHKQTKKN